VNYANRHRRHSKPRTVTVIPGWAVYHDGELVFSVDSDKWDTIGDAIKTIMESE
jgi:hypothetical protein